MNKNQLNSFIKKPIFIVGAGHSGTSIVCQAISKNPSITVWHENNKTWIWGNVFRKNHVLNKEDLTPKIKQHIRMKFDNYLRKSKKERICDKTPKNCLRIPFILSIFPDAKIIHIIRDGRAVVASTNSQVNKKSYPFLKQLKVKLNGTSFLDWYVFIPRIFFVIRKVLGLPVDYWGSKPENWEDWSNDEPYIRLAKQWNETVKHTIAKGRQSKAENYIEIHYEDFIADSTATMKKIAKFAEIADPQPMIDFCNSVIDPSRNSKRFNSLSTDDRNKIMEVIEPTLIDLGYDTKI